MHYTSIENIHKVIDPLFLDDLQAEFAQIKAMKGKTPKDRETRNAKIDAFQQKLASLKFLDPACGSGNFLTETYLSLRRLENQAISLRNEGRMVLGGIDNPIQVSISQFYGIEINDFAVTVAKTALWIAESQMMQETEAIVHMTLDFLPLKTNAYIVEGNALRLNWQDVVKPSELNFIMGNPPFVGYSLQSAEQKADIKNIYVDEKGKPYRTAGKIDYVAAWYFKAAEYMQMTKIRAAFVSTNSITQGEQVSGVWKPLFERFHVHIDFAWRTFKWGSESNNQAAVHCVIVGFSDTKNLKQKIIYDGNLQTKAENISPYLTASPTVFIESRREPLANVPEMHRGSQPTENRRYIPMDYLPAEVIAGDKIFMIPNANLYYFGVLTSNVHMSWMRTVAGRLKSDYSYSNTVVYNNFPWCNPTEAQRKKIEQTAQSILDARALYPDASLADLYDQLTMPKELRDAHQANDKAVMNAYGFDWHHMTESDCVAALMKMYQKLIAEKS